MLLETVNGDLDLGGALGHPHPALLPLPIPPETPSEWNLWSMFTWVRIEVLPEILNLRGHLTNAN